MLIRSHLPGFRRLAPIALALGASCFATLSDVEDASACGCVSPPIPTPESAEFAVNQQAEQIIFEVEETTVTAHVLIRYAGAPEKFAWIVPVPVPPDDLSLSESVTFGMFDQVTSPVVNVNRETVCPSPEYVCQSHPPPTGCQFPGSPQGTGGAGAAGGFDGSAGSAGASAGGAGGGPPPVTVIDREQIGGYDTVTFGAGDAGAAVAWLQAEGFIVNDTMTPFMQPYVDAGMVFVAAKLIAGADVDQIRPLAIKYQGQIPMIPLQLTAVAAEPHLTVTSYIFGDGPYQPVDHPLVGLDPRWITTGDDGRSNYPMVIARAADDAGGDGFVMEYAGSPPVSSLDTNGCCGSTFDNCGIGNDGSCQCPGDDFDAADCAEEESLVNGVTLYRSLREKHDHVTRLTLRLSPEEMSFDPMFEPMTGSPPVNGQLILNGNRKDMDACEADIIDRERHASIEQLQGCAAVYCGRGECVATPEGPGCACDPGFVVRQFTDLDGEASVTCVPDQAPVDFAAAGLTLPDSCFGIDCGAGTCVDVGGFPACQCAGGAGGVVTADGPAPACHSADRPSGSSGARDFTVAMEDVRACAPEPRECGQWAWLVPNQNKERQGVVCPSSIPGDPSRFEPPPAPTCEDFYGPGAKGPSPNPLDPFDPFDPFRPSKPPSGNGAGGTGASSGGGDVSASGGGCSVGNGATHPAWAVLGLFAVAALRRRRRD